MKSVRATYLPHIIRQKTIMGLAKKTAHAKENYNYNFYNAENQKL